MALADRIGTDALTIRKLAQALDVKPMTIYHHVAGKDAILDGKVDHVFAEIELPPADQLWREAILLRCRSMREVLSQHPWAAPLMEGRTSPGPALLRHHDAVLGCFRRAGFPSNSSAAAELVDARRPMLRDPTARGARA